MQFKKETFLILFGCLLVCTASAQNLHYQITGIEGELLENVQAGLHIKQHTHDTKLTEQQIRRIYNESPEEIESALQPYGYFHTTVKSSLLYNPKNHRWEAAFRINPGTQMHITHLDLKILGQGQTDPALKQYLSKPPLKEGQVFTTKRYNTAKHLLIDTAMQRGYLSASMQNNQVRIDRDNKTIAVILHLDTGPRYLFGPVRFSETPFKETFLTRFIPFKPGDIYSNETLTRLQQSLTDSNYFQTVEVVPHTKEAMEKNQQTVPISVNLRPNKGHQYLFGLGYGTDTGARGLFGIQLRHITATGQHLKSLLKASETETSLAAKYVIPGHNPVTDEYTLNAAINEEHEQFVGRSRSAELSANYVTMLGRWKQTLALNLLYDRSDPLGSDTNPFTSTLLYPTANWLYVTSDNPLRPSKGMRINFNIRGASKAVVSSINFIQAILQFKRIDTLQENTRVILRGSLGYTEVSDVEKLPLSLQFYVGGTHSIRGYRYKEIGPGKQLLSASLELQHRIYKYFYGTVFYDVGNTRNANITGSLKQGVGTGLFVLSPLGAISLTVAKALNENHRHVIVQFTMGPEL